MWAMLVANQPTILLAQLRTFPVRSKKAIPLDQDLTRFSKNKARLIAGPCSPLR
jgi:hypothetical protein